MDARLHDFLAARVAAGDVPGLVALVRRDDRVDVAVVGSHDVDGTRPMARDTIFRISSMTKPITAVGALLLVEGGVLSLDGAIDDLVPELADRRVLTALDAPLASTVPADRSITVRDLLTFTMGFGTTFEPMPISDALPPHFPGFGPPLPSQGPTQQEFLDTLSALPLMDQPGARWRYNTGSDVLGVVIERAAGQLLETFLRERVFDPLGMRDTAFTVDERATHRLPTEYGADGVFDPGGAASAWAASPRFATGGGGLVSTVDDYLAFLDLLLGRGTRDGVQLLQPATVDAMTTDQLVDGQRGDPILSDRGWGFGLSITGSRFGWDGGLGTSGYADRELDLVAVLMTQVAWSSPAGPELHDGFWSMVDEAYGAQP